MSLAVLVPWLAATGLMLARAVRAIVAARAAPDQLVSRARVLGWAGATAALSTAAVWAWCASLAVRAATPRGAARAELRTMRIPLGDHVVAGFSPAADLELPSSWTLDEIDHA